MSQRLNLDSRCPRWLPLVAVLLLVGLPVRAIDVVVQLRNGDRITGQLLTQDTNQIVIATTWASQLVLPIPLIGGLRTADGVSLLKEPPPSPPPAASAPSPPPASPATPAKPPQHWKVNFDLGLNLIYGATDSQLYYGTFQWTYARPYASNPKKFFRNVLGYTVNYGETDGAQSANNMGGTIKTDWDVGERTYLYNAGAVGYDQVRKIDLLYSIGPGVGYHLFTKPRWVMNVESGLNYHVEERSIGADQESVYLRLGDDLTWKISDRVSLTQKYEFFQNLEQFDQFRFQLNATLSYALWQGISLNLSALDLYDSNPAPGVERNELQLRTTVGITF